MRISGSGLIRPLLLLRAGAGRDAGSNGQDTAGTSWLSRFGFDELPQWFLGARNMWDFANNKWNLWVMEYSIAGQNRLFSRIGINISRNKGMIQAAFYCNRTPWRGFFPEPCFFTA